MALDVAEFLWNKFLKSLTELESELDSITIRFFSSIKDLVPYFKAIKDVVNERDIMPERYTYSETINVLYKLNDALAECRVFTHEYTELNNKFPLFNYRRITFVGKMKSRLVDIKGELEKLPQQEICNRRENTQFTGSRPKLSAKVFGFDEQLKKIEVFLQAGGSSCSSGGELRAIGVVGIAGVGKTTLVQKVLESEGVKQRFNPILWLPFSGMSEGEQQYSRFSFETCIFDSNGKIIKENDEIIEENGKTIEENDEIIEGRIVGLDKLLERLSRQLLSGKCYLIVLDDVCHRHINIMERLCSRLPKHIGSAIIVTTRLKEVAQKLGKQHELKLVHVEPLDRKICGLIFEEIYGARCGGFTSEEATKKMEEIKNQCHGLPLVAKKIAKTAPGSGGDRFEERDGRRSRGRNDN